MRPTYAGAGRADYQRGLQRSRLGCSCLANHGDRCDGEERTSAQRLHETLLRSRAAAESGGDDSGQVDASLQDTLVRYAQHVDPAALVTQIGASRGGQGG